jgi:hypothetical protein
VFHLPTRHVVGWVPNEFAGRGWSELKGKGESSHPPKVASAQALSITEGIVDLVLPISSPVSYSSPALLWRLRKNCQPLTVE